MTCTRALRRRVVYVLIVAALLALPAPAGAEQEDGSIAQTRAILATLDASPPASVEEAANALVDLGPKALPALLELWWTSPSETGRAAGQARTQVVEQAIEQRSPAERTQAIKHRLADDPSGDDGLLVLRALARFGDASNLGLALDAVAGLPPSWYRSIPVLQAWSKVLEAVHPNREGLEDLQKQWGRVPEPLRVPVASHVASRGSGSEMRTLLQLIEHSDGDTVKLLQAVGRAPSVVLAQEHTSRALRAYTKHPDRRVRAQATRLVGRVRVKGAFKGLIVLLGDSDARVRESAHAALHAITGVRLKADPDAWRAWHENELTWLGESDLDARLSAEKPAVVAAAMCHLIEHAFVGAKYAPHLFGLLDDERPELRRLACAALQGILGARAASHVVPLLDDPDASVREAAWLTLLAISGENLPRDPKAWRDAVRRWTS